VIDLRCVMPAMIGSRIVNPACARSRTGWFSSMERRSRQTSLGCVGGRLSRNGSMAPHPSASGVLKAHLRRIGARTFDTLLQALRYICDLFDLQECWNFLKAAGYASD